MTQLDERTQRVTILSGVETLIRLLMIRQQLDERDGLNTATMVSGYPGSPLGTFDLTLERAGEQLGEHRVIHRPGLNEELAVSTVWGSQMGEVLGYQGVDGVVGAWYGKGPGLDRSGDALKHANAMGAGPNGGVVAFCGDDPSSKSSTLACDSQYTFEDVCMPVLYPADQQDILDLGVHAYRLSRYAGAWVGFKIVTSVADGVGSVDLDLERHAPSDPVGVLVDGKAWRHQPLSTVGAHPVPDQEALVVDRRLQAAQAYVRHNGLDRVIGAGAGARLGIVCAGKTYRDVVQALAELGLSVDDLAGAGIRVLKLAMTYPVVPETVCEFAESVDEVVVIEEKRPFIETQLRSILHEAGSRVPVLGKRDRSGQRLTSSVGELSSTAIAKALTHIMPELSVASDPDPAEAAERIQLPMLQIPGRPPAFCSGCPHNRSTVFPDGALVGGGVGCHGIMYFESRHAGMTAMPPTPMGSEGVPWIGLSPFVNEPHLIQNLGDGTLSHSGTLAIRACVAADVNVTFKILYNKAVAMTGGQDVTGTMDVPALTRSLEAEGVRRIVVCAEDPKRYGRKARWAHGVQVYGRGRLEAVQTELEQVSGVSVIIYDQRCAAEARRLRKKGLLPEPPQRVVINEGVCEGCGDCSRKSNCLSVLPVDTEFGEKRMIDDLSCNRDYTCIEGDCPSFVTVTPATRGRRRVSTSGDGSGGRTGTARANLPTGVLPMPQLPDFESQYGIYFTGIGGTGVVTANRILAYAAENAGLVIGGMDQTGLSQKAGAVVSHLHLARNKDVLGSAAVGEHGADLYLSSDILQAAGQAHLAKVAPGRTIAVVDREITPTASMLQGGATAPELSELETAITGAVGAERLTFLDSNEIASAVFANHLLANIIMLGAAFQLGGLPLSLADIEAAIGRQGKAAAANREAFEWGRWTVHDPAKVAEALAAVENEDGTGASVLDPSPSALIAAGPLVAARRLPEQLQQLLTRRTAQVIDYQNTARAERFLDLVEQVAAHDEAGREWALTRAVIESWFKLLTYKDEYEVARLHLKVDYDKVARELGIEGPYTVTYHLHPPILRRLGVKNKLPMGRPYELAFQVLQRMKGLRGTRFDPFGLDPDRRTERALIDEYARLIEQTTGPRSDLPYERQVRLAESPLEIKGYAGIKETAAAEWRAEVTRLRNKADSAISQH